jgi:hypothetical protein
MKEREYIAVMPCGYLTLIEITPERREIIDEEYEGDIVECYEDVILREFDFSQSDTWAVLTESSMFCYGKAPIIPC